MIPSIYLDLEDDVSRITARLKKEKSLQAVLVCPKRCFLFSDSINLRLLKKQADLLKKEVYILTMDERGQAYAKEAGFGLKFLPKHSGGKAISDIRANGTKSQESAAGAGVNMLAQTVKEIKNITKLFSKETGQPRPPVRNKSAERARHAANPEKTQRKIHHTPTVEVSEPKVMATDSIFPPEIEESYKLRKKKAANQRIATGLVAVSLITILALVFVVLPKAEVVIYPKFEPITRDIDVTISPSIQSADSGRLLLPATKVNETMKVFDKFQSQGKKEVGNKATGTVRIYNFTGQALNLKAATTVLTAGGKSYSLAEDAMWLKAAVYLNSKTKEVDPASLPEPITIVAQDGGESFNLPAGARLEITNQVFGSKPQSLYAKTDSPITGGTSRLLSVVTDQDINNAQTALQEKFVQNVQAELQKKNLAIPTSPSNAYVLNDIKFAGDKPAGTQSPAFQANLSATLTGLAYDSQALDQLILDRIGQTLSGNKNLEVNGEQGISVKLKSYDPGSQIAILTAHFEGQAVMNISLNGLASELAGKNKTQANEILRSKADIDRIEMTVAPSWQNTLPWLKSKITVKTGDVRNLTGN
ncbi:MAG: hypothetical protein M1383_04380 [Patescibacteria group bacterium]|nr:hypothetical protein [Patescibacteria group bacterium]